jgi:hypothetical protein
MFHGCHIPATQSLYLPVWFSRNTDVDVSHLMSLMNSRKTSVKPFRESVKLTDIAYSYEINIFIKKLQKEKEIQKQCNIYLGICFGN